MRMARIIRSFRFRTVTCQRYPWREWLDGRIRQFKRGVDFECEAPSFVLAARFWAKRRDFNVQASVSGNTVTMQAVR